MSEKERKKLVNKQYYIKRKLITKANKLIDMFDGVKVSLRFLGGFIKKIKYFYFQNRLRKFTKVRINY